MSCPSYSEYNFRAARPGAILPSRSFTGSIFVGSRTVQTYADLTRPTSPQNIF
jgi:hypothetical protein